MLIPILFIMAAIYVICREWVEGKSETEVELAPGKHTLTLQFANGAHQSYGADMSETITIEVVE